MTSASRLSRESTTRSSVLPQNGQRILKAVYHDCERFRVARHILGGMPEIAPAQPFAREEHHAGDDDRKRADEVQQQRGGDRGVDVEAVERRQRPLAKLVESADAAGSGDGHADRRHAR